MDSYRNSTSGRLESHIHSLFTNTQHASPSGAFTSLWHLKGTIFMILFFLRAIYNLFFHPLRNVPGPFLARSSSLWRLIRYFRGSWHDDVIELHKKYGQVVRISPEEVSFTDQDAIKMMYGHGRNVSKVRIFHSMHGRCADAVHSQSFMMHLSCPT